MEMIPEGNFPQQLADGQTYTRAYFESITTNELIRIADNLGIDIPPDLDRKFIIEELLEITSPDEPAEDTASAADTPDASAGDSAKVTATAVVPPEGEMADSGLVESVPLPKHYNITFIEVMIRDPLWAFVFWEIKTQDKEHFEKATDFEGYYLKVSPWVKTTAASMLSSTGRPAAPGGDENETEGVFTVPVTPTDSAWYLGLNPATEQGKSHLAQSQNEQKTYKVELCAGTKGGETVLAVSNPFKLPQLHELPMGGENPLARLSGYGDFHILRKNERMFRAKRGASSGFHE